ncbi:hypothetical protein pb186bvf_020041 [Paramecium bursaria]
MTLQQNNVMDIQQNIILSQKLNLYILILIFFFLDYTKIQNKMGNDFCQSSDLSTNTATKRKNKFTEILHKINNHFMNECKDQQFVQFHKDIIVTLIVNNRKCLCKSSLDLIYEQPINSQMENEIHKIIRGDLYKRNRNLFKGLLDAYGQFLQEHFELESYSPNKFDQRISIIASRFSESSPKNKRVVKWDNTRNTQSIDVEFMFQTNRNLANSTIRQLSCMIHMFKLIIKKLYGKQLNQIYGDSIDTQADKELMIGRIIQQELLTQKFPLACILPTALKFYYEKSLLRKHEKLQPTLTGSLIPPSQCQSLIEISPSLQDSTKQFDAIVEENQEATISSVPYHQTFPLLQRIFDTNKPWLKFKLIGKLDQMIVQIFMQKRSNSQYQQNFDIIQAEDSKSEILHFILHKFIQQYKTNLKETLLDLKWMRDSDQIISKDMKNLLCPYFMRFLIIFEMVYNNYE